MTLPAIIASSRPGNRGRKILKSTAVTSVTPETASTVGLASPRCRKTFSQMWMNACCLVPGMPRKVLTWLVAISRAAPAVNPTTTEWEMKLTRAPRRASPSASWNAPAMKVSVRTIRMYSAPPGSASGAMVVNTTMEIAVVGPEIRWREEPKSAATIAGTIALYSPYSGGSPAIIANATPCGSTMIAPVIPASRSARVLRAVIRSRQRRKGSSRPQSNPVRPPAIPLPSPRAIATAPPALRFAAAARRTASRLRC